MEILEVNSDEAQDIKEGKDETVRRDNKLLAAATKDLTPEQRSLVNEVSQSN